MMGDPRLTRLRELLAECCKGKPIPVSADALARSIGCRNRHELNRLLRYHRLPSPAALRALARILRLRSGFDVAGSGYRAAIEMYVAPEWLYRSCSRVLGARWSEVRSWPPDRIIDVALGRGR